MCYDERVWEIVHRAFHKPKTDAYRRTDALVYTLILLSIGLLLARPFVQGELAAWMDRTDVLLLWGFAVELILRVASYRPPEAAVFQRGPWLTLRAHIGGRVAYLLRPGTLVDLVTVLAVVPALRGLRAIRLLRLVRSARVFRYGNPFEGIFYAFDRDRLLWTFAFTLLGAQAVLGGVSLYLIERETEGGVESIGQGIWWAIVTLTTVGYGDISPVTDLGRIVAGFLMVGGMFTLAVFAGIVGHSLMNAVLSIREEQFRMSGFSNHIVVCGYESESDLLLRALEDELDLEDHKVVLFAPIERPPGIPPEFHWVQGDPTKESELEKVRLVHSASILVAGRRSITPSLADAETLMVLFTVRAHLEKQKLNQARKTPVHVVAEILDHENVEHARTAGADEVIETLKLGYAMLSHTVLFHGVGDVTAEVVAAGAHNFYVGEIPEELREKTFGEVTAALRAEHGILTVGLRDPASGRHTFNPNDDVKLDRDALVVYLADAPALPSPL